MRAGVYTRLSRLKETPELTAAAMARQDEDTLKLAADRGWEVVKTYSDPGVSAADDVVRREFEEALSDLGDGTIDVLVIPKFDRMTRGLTTWLRVERVLKDSGGIIASVADGDLDVSTPAGRFMLRQRAQFASYELEMMSERVTRWHQQRAHAGKPLVSGRRPFGYVDKQRSKVEPFEAAVIEYAAELLLGGKSLNQVTAWANGIGSQSPTGRPWLARTFGSMLASPGVAGLRAYRGEVVAVGKWTPILDRATHEALAAKFNATKGKPGRPPTHLLSGLLRCGRCGGRMLWAHHLDRKRGLPDRRQYACRRRPGSPNCGRMTISAEPVELLVAERVLDRLSKRLGRAFRAVGDVEVDVAAAELVAAELARDEVEQMHTSGAIRSDAFLRMHGPAEARVEQARRRLGSVTGKSVLADLPSGAEALLAWWYTPTRTTDERRTVLQAVLTEVIVRPSGPRMSKFDPDRVVIPREAWKV
jgi:site-specific DNA recombinase